MNQRKTLTIYTEPTGSRWREWSERSDSVSTGSSPAEAHHYACPLHKPLYFRGTHLTISHRLPYL